MKYVQRYTSVYKNRQVIICVCILLVAFSISFGLRAQSAQFGVELNEFDPFFNYRATEYLLNNGVIEYYNWHDDKSWHPIGRDVSGTSQMMQHVTAASLYSVFGMGTTLYEFVIWLPVIIGSLTVFVMFGLVRMIAGTAAGLAASLMFAVSFPVLVRGTVGWFKSEPLGLFFGLSAIWSLLSGFYDTNIRFAIIKVTGAGVLTAFALSAWGGAQFLVMIIVLFFAVLPFMKSGRTPYQWVLPVLYTAPVMIVSLYFERVTDTFSEGYAGLGLMGITFFVTGLLYIQQKRSKVKRESIIFIFVVVPLVFAGGFVVLDEVFNITPTVRYLNAISPVQNSENELFNSVAEHGSISFVNSLIMKSTLLVVAGAGAFIALKSKTKRHYAIFAIIFGVAGMYVGSTFLRLELVASLGLIILSSFTIPYVLKLRRQKKMFIMPIIIFLMIIPMFFPISVFAFSNTPPTILNGGSQYAIVSNDWKHALNWISEETPEDSVIGAWWDYGYWIQTMGDRKTLSDNSTMHSDIIKRIAEMFFQEPETAYQTLRDMDADYILTFIVYDKVGENDYVLHGGGDESKKQWLMRIAGVGLPQYLQGDGITPTDKFWEETMMGEMFPFSVKLYHNFQTGENSLEYRNGFVPIYEKHVKSNNLIYSSPSYDETGMGIKLGIFIYEVPE